MPREFVMRALKVRVGWGLATGWCVKQTSYSLVQDYSLACQQLRAYDDRSHPFVCVSTLTLRGSLTIPSGPLNKHFVPCWGAPELEAFPFFCHSCIPLQDKLSTRDCSILRNIWIDRNSLHGSSVFIPTMIIQKYSHRLLINFESTKSYRNFQVLDWSDLTSQPCNSWWICLLPNINARWQISLEGYQFRFANNDKRKNVC